MLSDVDIAASGIYNNLKYIVQSKLTFIDRKQYCVS